MKFIKHALMINIGGNHRAAMVDYGKETVSFELAHEDKGFEFCCSVDLRGDDVDALIDLLQSFKELVATQ